MARNGKTKREKTYLVLRRGGLIPAQSCPCFIMPSLVPPEHTWQPRPICELEYCHEAARAISALVSAPLFPSWNATVLPRHGFVDQNFGPVEQPAAVRTSSPDIWGSLTDRVIFLFLLPHAVRVLRPPPWRNYRCRYIKNRPHRLAHKGHV